MKSLGKFGHDDDVVTKKKIDGIVTYGRKFNLAYTETYKKKIKILLSFKDTPMQVIMSLDIGGFYNKADDTGIRSYVLATNNGGGFCQFVEVGASGSTTFIKNSKIESFKTTDNQAEIIINLNETSSFSIRLEGTCIRDNELIYHSVEEV